MRESILVTGANGLIGYEVVKRLAGAGRNVIAVDRTVSDVATLTGNAFPLEIGDQHRLHELADRFQIDAIVHCGGVSGPMLGRDNPAALFNTNIGGTIDVAEVARQRTLHGHSCRLLFCSSLTVYGNQPQDGIRESNPLLTRQCYASSKVAGEAVVLSYVEEHDLDAIVLRIAGVYGPRRRTSCVLRLMIQNALEGRPTYLRYGQGFPRQWVHVDDIAAGLILALDVEAPTERVFNLSGGVNPTIDEAADIIRAVIPAADIRLDPGADPEDITLGLLSIEAARRVLGYEPSVTLRDGIHRLIQSMRSGDRPNQ
ncbi:NAD-dependent epimerase/dehydratase family protein [Rhizobium sp. SYY.PMSO]|uniref:NAD-dependent epimerase/dehydratase family protein n=1 Tax=Rhizobium sp. SYY.PMSO TaxID=3382192 RepID=UPI00398F9A22